MIYLYIHSICETCKLDTRPIHCIWVWEHPRLHCSDPEPSRLSARSQLIWSVFLQQRSRTLLGFSVCSRKWIRNGNDMDVRWWMEMKWRRPGRVLLGSRLSELWGSHCHEFSPTFEAMAPIWRCIKCSYDSTSYTQELLVFVDIIPRLYHIVMKSNQIVSNHQIIGGMTLILNRNAFRFDAQNPQFLAAIPPFFMAISHFLMGKPAVLMSKPSIFDAETTIFTEFITTTKFWSAGMSTEVQRLCGSNMCWLGLEEASKLGRHSWGELGGCAGGFVWK